MGVGDAPRALVVEDDSILRLLGRVNLELEGFEVQEAGTLAEAERALDDGPPDVVLLDVLLGGKPCDELLERLQAEGVPVALVTGLDRADSYADRVDAIISKPYEPSQLVAVARRLADAK
jgi:DNA-binding response OmpR family regulator